MSPYRSARAGESIAQIVLRKAQQFSYRADALELGDGLIDENPDTCFPRVGHRIPSDMHVVLL